MTPFRLPNTQILAVIFTSSILTNADCKEIYAKISRLSWTLQARLQFKTVYGLLVQYSQNIWFIRSLTKTSSKILDTILTSIWKKKITSHIHGGVVYTLLTSADERGCVASTTLSHYASIKAKIKKKQNPVIYDVQSNQLLKCLFTAKIPTSLFLPLPCVWGPSLNLHTL